jgi:large subunit ribosomal protein L22
MEVIAKGKYVGVSPKKARAVANLIRGKNAKESVYILAQMPQAGASDILKVLKSAMANAENNFNLDQSLLNIAKITVNAGPTIKRFQPRSKGMANPIKRRTSHIEIIVSGDIKTKALKAKKKEPENMEVAEEDHEHTLEMNRPEDKKVYTTTPKDMGRKMFRRKTG